MRMHKAGILFLFFSNNFSCINTLDRDKASMQSSSITTTLSNYSLIGIIPCISLIATYFLYTDYKNSKKPHHEIEQLEHIATLQRYSKLASNKIYKKEKREIIAFMKKMGHEYTLETLNKALARGDLRNTFSTLITSINKVQKPHAHEQLQKHKVWCMRLLGIIAFISFFNGIYQN